MITTSWNEAEDEALQGLPLEAQLLYLRGLRRHMDYGTGIVGQRRRISWQMLSETLEVEHHKGVAGVRMDKNKLRRLVAWLAKRGLVEQRNDGRYLVFWLPLADTDSSVRKKAEPRPNHVRTTKAEPRPYHQQSNDNIDLREIVEETRTTPAPPEDEKAEPHPVSGIRNPKEGKEEREKMRARAFRIVRDTEFGAYRTKTEAHERIIQTLEEQFMVDGWDTKREHKVYGVTDERNGFIDLIAELDGFVCAIEVDSTVRKKSLQKLNISNADLPIQLIYTRDIALNSDNDMGVWFIGRRLFFATARAARSPGSRGTRLPEDWTLPADWQAWALTEQPTWTPEHCRKVAASFRDYWVAKTGANATKRDWLATWRNWVRREGPMRQGGGSGSTYRYRTAEAREDRNRQAAQAFLSDVPRRTPAGLIIEATAEEETTHDERPRQAALR